MTRDSIIRALRNAPRRRRLLIAEEIAGQPAGAVVTLTPADLQAIRIVLDAAVENSCSCADEKVDRKSGHQRDCWCHHSRGLIARVAKIVERAK